MGAAGEHRGRTRQRRGRWLRRFAPELVGFRCLLHRWRGQRGVSADLEHQRRLSSTSTSARARSATTSRCRHGSYVVRLHFAELFFSSAGVRRFNVDIEGAPRHVHFDIYAQAGKASLITQLVHGHRHRRHAERRVQQGLRQRRHRRRSTCTRPAAASTCPRRRSPPSRSRKTRPTPPRRPLTLAITDNVGLNDGYWRVDDGVPQPLFESLGQTGWNGQFTHAGRRLQRAPARLTRLSFGANDDLGNAWTQTWRFRKLNTGGSATPIAFDRRASPQRDDAGRRRCSSIRPRSSSGRMASLYVGQQDFFGKGGYIHALTLDVSRNVTNVQRIIDDLQHAERQPERHPAPTVVGRHLIGIDFDPASTPERPILWAVHSDPRFCFNQTPDDLRGQHRLRHAHAPGRTGLRRPGQSHRLRDRAAALPREPLAQRGPLRPRRLAVHDDRQQHELRRAEHRLQRPGRAVPDRRIVRFNVNGAPAAFPIDVRTIDGRRGHAPGHLRAVCHWLPQRLRLPLALERRAVRERQCRQLHRRHHARPGRRLRERLRVRPRHAERLPRAGRPGRLRRQPEPDPGQVHPRRRDDVSGSPRRRPTPTTARRTGCSTTRTAPRRTAWPSTRRPTFGGQMLGNIISATYAGNQSVRRVVLAADGRASCSRRIWPSSASRSTSLSAPTGRSTSPSTARSDPDHGAGPRARGHLGLPGAAAGRRPRSSAWSPAAARCTPWAG